MKPLAVLVAALTVAGCQQSPAENKADQLDNAAAQSDPVAAPALKNAADALRAGETSNMNATAQKALSEGGAAQARADGNSQ